jgi:nicotinate dehydrogenase subunit B
MKKTEEFDTHTTADSVSRRDFLKGTGALVVSFTMGEVPIAGAAAQDAASPQAASAAAGVYNALVLGPDPRQLDSWLKITADGGVTFFTGKNDNGQGLSTAYRQLVADELDAALPQVTVIFADTRRTPDQRGASPSSTWRA